MSVVYFPQRNRLAGAVLETPPDRDTMEVPTVLSQHTPLVTIEQEEWRPVVGWEGLYEVSSLARVRRIAGGAGATPGRILCPSPIPGGYVTVGLCRDGRRYTKGVHVLVAHAFLGHCPPGHEVHHRDNNRANPLPGNLEYLTHAENIRHAVEFGNFCKGERGVHARLTEQSVREIRLSSLNNTQLGRLYGVTRTAIAAVRSGRSWGHLDRPVAVAGDP